MTRRPWNRNIHYHRIVLGAIPPDCRRALDVGSGDGRLARELAERCGAVVGIDVHAPTLVRARSARARANLSFVEGDVMTHAFADGSFDLIASIATLHHLPLEPALIRFRDLLRPGGVIAVIGLYRNRTLVDYAYGCAAVAVTWWMRLSNEVEPVMAPIPDPEETLSEIRALVEKILPGATMRRELLFRYSLIWRKPGP